MAKKKVAKKVVKIKDKCVWVAMKSGKLDVSMGMASTKKEMSLDMALMFGTVIPKTEVAKYTISKVTIKF